MARSHQEAGQDARTTRFGASVIRFPTPPNLGMSQLEGDAESSSHTNAEDGIVRKLECLIEQRRLREQHFPLAMLADPAWDIFLDLALAEHEQRRVTISNLCVAARVPATTALRWIKHMTEDGWLVREEDRLDARRSFIGLSREASAKMSAYITSID